MTRVAVIEHLTHRGNAMTEPVERDDDGHGDFPNPIGFERFLLDSGMRRAGGAFGSEATVIDTSMTLREKLEALALRPLLKEYRFVLANGRAFGTDQNTFKGRRMAAKQCFRNAARLHWEKPGLVYCEGFVDAGGFPIHHAWCVTDAGMVIEPTLSRKLLDGSERALTIYFGVPFKSDYLLRHAREAQTYDLSSGHSPISIELITGKIQPEEFLNDGLITSAR
jgi:hypothetical protein